MSLEILLNLGFTESATCTLNENQQLQIHIVNNLHETNILYAFVTNGIVRYIGITTRTFDNRMNGYRRPGRSQSTNISINQRVSQLLHDGNEVQLYVFADRNMLQFRGLNINLAAAIENNLIQHIAHFHNDNDLPPLWNIWANPFINMPQIDAIEAQQEEQMEEELIYPQMEQVVPNPHGIVNITIDLGITYMEAGYINLGVYATDHIAGDGEPITVELTGANPTVLHKHINRRANSNGTPRLHLGPDFIQWVNANHQLYDMLEIQIIDPNHVRLV